METRRGREDRMHETTRDKPGMNEADEAERIYRAIFRKSVPSQLKERYHRAIDAKFTDFSAREKRNFEMVLKKVRDLEALELAARHQNKMPLLISRFRLMVHLAENLPANQSLFINSSDRRITSYFSLLFGSARTLFKGLKGRFLLRRAGHV